MTNLVDHLKAPPRADRGAIYDLGFMISDWGRALAATGRHIRNQKSAIRNPSSRGLTLIEMLVALAVTLVMMAAVVNLFANMTGSIRNRRAAIEAGAQLRQVRQRLALDFQGATSQGIPWQDPAENQGYIEIIEGEWTDKNPSQLLLDTDLDGLPDSIDATTSLLPSSQKIDPSVGQVTDGRALGDWDDIIALTVRSESDPFVGVDDLGTPANGDDVTVESPLAEVIWFANERPAGTPPDAYDGMRTVYRRVLLIAPWRGPWTTDEDNPPKNISARWDQTRNQWVANTLSDLTKRENRACRLAISDFPHALERGRLFFAHGGGVGFEAVALSNTLAFDVRVFDPTAPLFENSGVVVGPCDAGFRASDFTAIPSPKVGEGDYVDLNYRASYDRYIFDMNMDTSLTGTLPATPLSLFSELPHDKSRLRAPLGRGGVYDTWSYHYENDGINQDAYMDDIVDQGTNGLDDDGINGVDDKGERETSPPYDTPLLGVKVLFRVYERDARQIREASVTHSFKP